MKKVIINKMGVEARTLWELSKKSRLSGPFAALLAEHVQEIKGEFGSYNTEDLLKQKAKKFKKSGSWGKHTIAELPKMVYDEQKKPYEVYKGEWVSVELEVIMRSREVETNFAAFVKAKGWSRYVTLKNDGSLRVGSESQCRCGEESRREHRSDCGRDSYGKEIVVTFRYGHWEMIKELCSFLNRSRSTVNKSCGLHVHFDCRHLTPEQVVEKGQKVAAAVNALKSMLPRSRQDNQYCSEPINSMISPSNRNGDRQSRYAFVNLHAYERHKTIEFRGHSGTADSNKIINWIKIMRILMDAPAEYHVDTIAELVARVDFGDELKTYMVERATKFALAGARRNNNVDDVYEDDSNTQPAPDATPQRSSSVVEETLRRLAAMLVESTAQRATAAVDIETAPAQEAGVYNYTIQMPVPAMRFTNAIVNIDMDNLHPEARLAEAERFVDLAMQAVAPMPAVLESFDDEHEDDWTMLDDEDSEEESA